MNYNRRRRILERRFRQWDEKQNGQQVSKYTFKKPRKNRGVVIILAILLGIVAIGVGLGGGFLVEQNRLNLGDEVSFTNTTRAQYIYVDRLLPNAQADFDWSGDYHYLGNEDIFKSVVSAYGDYVEIGFERIPVEYSTNILENITIEVKMSGFFSHMNFAFSFTGDYRYDITEDYPTPWGHIMSSGNSQILTTTLHYSGLGYTVGQVNDGFLKVWSMKGIYISNLPIIDYINIISVGHST